jgi:hypothetical protein
VRLINLKKTAEIAAIARVPRSEDDEETMDSDELEGNDNNTETDSEA